ncbi:MAG: exo-alpha-sialidase [Candidatus Cryptobacteroides sp.]
MKYTIYSIYTVLSLAAACAHGTFEDGSSSAETVLHSLEDVNLAEEETGSHKGWELRSTLEPLSVCSLGRNVLSIEDPYYPRIKKCADGSFLLMWQNGQIGSTIYCCTSSDLKNWSVPKKIFAPVDITTPDGADVRRYSSADAVVLSDGDVIAVTSFRAHKGYKYYPECNGISIRRSRDNGKTWSEEQVIYQGTNWEPYILELPSGRLHCYFTDTDPLLRNSGTSLVRSDDRGQTWSPSGPGQRERVIRQYKYLNQGKRIYTDQMPCIRMLNDGHTLLGFMEARLEEGNVPGGTSSYRMGLVYGKDDWKVLADDEEGPQDRMPNLFLGGGGYVGQFLSGETLISCNINGLFSIKTGTCDGRTFRGKSWDDGWFRPFTGKGCWGSTEVISSHEVLAVMNDTQEGTIQLGRLYLNHRIDAPSLEVSTDGSSEEWKGGHALYVGSADGDVSAIIRAAHDKENLYILLERSDKALDKADGFALYLTSGSASVLDGAVRVSYTIADGASYSSYSGNWKDADIKGADCVTTVLGNPSDGKSDKGCVTEICLPLSCLPGVSLDSVLIDAVVSDGDRRMTFSGADTLTPEGWLPIRIL